MKDNYYYNIVIADDVKAQETLFINELDSLSQKEGTTLPRNLRLWRMNNLNTDK